MKVIMKKILSNDIFIRACKTFLQGFLGSLIVFLNNNTTFDEKVIKSAIIGAIAGGLSATMNFVYDLLKRSDK